MESDVHAVVQCLMRCSHAEVLYFADYHLCAAVDCGGEVCHHLSSQSSGRILTSSPDR